MPNKKLIKATAMGLAVMLLISTYIAMFMSSTQDRSHDIPSSKVLTTLKGGQKWQRNGLSDQNIHAKLYNLTLITGDSVLVRVAENGTILSVAVNPSDPAKLGQSFIILEMHNFTYVIPSNIDINKFDLELFNIDLLIKEKYYELPYIPIIVEYSTIINVNINTIVREINTLGGKLAREFHIVPMLTAKLPNDKVKRLGEFLASSPDIRKIWLDRKVHSNLYESGPLIGTPDAWALGLNGTGIRIAIIDTGIDASHADFFFPNGTSKIERAVSFIDYDGDGIPDETPDDYFGHGTHVASIAAGTGQKSIITPIVLDVQSAISRFYDDMFARISTNRTHIAMVWHSYYSGNWDIWFSIYDGHYWKSLQQLTTNSSRDVYPFVTFLKDGRILVLWTSNRTGDYQIWYKVYDKGSWSPDKQLTIGPNWHVYSPVTQLSNGSIAIAYTSNASSNIDVWFAVLNLDNNNTLNWVSNRKLTNANSTMWLYSSSIVQSPNGKIWVFTYDLYNFNFTTNVGGITQIYYNVSTDMGATWSGGLLASGSGFVNPSATVLPDGTIMLVFEGDDLDRNIPYTIWYMVYQNNVWSQPKILTPGKYLAVPSIVYAANLGKFYITAQNWINPDLQNDIFLLNIPIFRGIAYGATLWNVKVLNRWGWGYLSWVIAGVEYAALGPDYTPNTGDEAGILNLSLGAYWWTDGTDPLSRACDAATDAGRVVVVAAGNLPGYFHIGVPATARKVITVGATDKQDELAWFSSWGPTIDFRIKPDIVAPGVSIWAALAKGSRIEYWANRSLIPAIDVDGDGRYDYVRLSGTSMSTPHISGVVALIKQLSPSLTPLEVKNKLISTANDLGYNVYQQGGGRVNVTSVIDLPVLVNPATISFGVITTDMLLNSTISFTFSPPVIPLNVQNITLSLNVTLRDILTGTTLNAANLNTTTITIPLFESRTILLTVNTSLTKSLYEGKIIAKIINGPWINRTLHIIFGFARMNSITIMMLDREGKPAVYSPIVIFKHRPTSYLDVALNSKFGWTDENGMMKTYVTDGKFYVIGLDRNYTIQVDIYTIEEVYIFGNTRITLDESSAQEVNFDPNRPNQVFCSKQVSINYYQKEPFWYSLSFGSYWYYPRSPLTYMSSTTLNVTFGYQYYPAKYFNPAAPEIIDTPLWHHLLYAELGVTTPKMIVANYTEFVKIVSDYKVGVTPRVGAYIWPYLITPLFPSFGYGPLWLMNAPQSRVEYISPNTFDWPWYWKYNDPPWISTPFWFFEEWRIYPPSTEVYEKWGQHPFQTILNGYFWNGILYLYGHVFADSSIVPHTFHNWQRYPAGHIKVWRNDTLIWEGDVDDFFWIGIGGQTFPSKFKVAINGWSGQWLSTYSYYEYEFIRSGPSGYWFPSTPPVWIDGLDLNNTHMPGDVGGIIPVSNYELVHNITLEYSVDDGATWESVSLVPSNITLPATIAGESIIVPGYRFTLTNLSDVYVSLRVNVTYTVDGIRQSQTTIRSFYVKPYIIITVGPPGSGANYTSIREAVQAAPPYSQIRVFPGTYVEGVVTIDKPLTIIANASGTMVTGIIPFYVTNTKVIIKGLTISGSIGIFASNSDIILHYSNITGNDVGLLAIDSIIRIKDTDISYNRRDGLALYGDSKATVINCTLRHNGGAGVVITQYSRASLSLSEVYYNKWGILLFDVSNLKISNSIIYSNTLEGIAILSDGNAEVIYTKIHDNRYGLTIRGHSNSLIFKSQITNNNEVGIVTADEANVILNGSLVKDNMHGIVAYDTSRITVYNSTIMGGNEGILAVRHSYVSLENSYITSNNIAGILAIESSKVDLYRTVVRNSSWAGIAVYGKSTVNIDHSYIYNTTWEAIIAWERAHINVTHTVLFNSGRGVTSGVNSTVLILNVEIRDVRFEGLFAVGNSEVVVKDTLILGSGISGISAYDSPHILLVNTTIKESVWANVAAFHSSSFIIKNSSLILSGASGIVVLDNATVLIESSRISSNIWGIMVFGNGNVTLSKVVLFNNTWDGLVVWENSKAYVINSTLMSNRYGATAYNNATLVIHYTSIINNTDFGVLNRGTITINATYNWWGDPSGPYHPELNPNGTGDRVSDLVLFRPWLTAPPEWWNISISGFIEYANLTYGAGIVAEVRPDSLAGIDPLDAEAPPAPPEGLDMFFLVGDVKCLVDARPSATTIAWHFAVSAVNVEGIVTLTWDTSLVPLKYARIILIDESTGIMIDMRSQTSYSFYLGPGELREFTILVMVGG